MPICARLLQPVVLADDVAFAFGRAVWRDCRVGRMLSDRPDELYIFSNLLVNWNLWFWGCPEVVRQSEFGLVHRADALTWADANVLIDHYLAVTTNELSLSTEEGQQFRKELALFARDAVVDPSAETYSMSNCTEPGGAGGAGGEGGGSAGAGGEPSVGNGGTSGLGGGTPTAGAGGDSQSGAGGVTP